MVKKIRVVGMGAELRVGAEVTGKGQEGTFWGNSNVLHPIRDLGYTHLCV